MMGIPSSIISDIENEKREPSKDFLHKFSQLYAISLNWLYFGVGPKGLVEAISTEETAPTYITDSDVSLFKFSHGKPKSIPTHDSDPNALTMVPIFSQRAAAGAGQPPTQLAEIEAYIPIIFELLGGALPKNCGAVRVVGDSMTDMTLFNGDLVIFDRSQIEGDGVYVISIGSDVRIKRLEYRVFDKKVIIRSENQKRYPDPEIISFEEASQMLMIHGKVISWVHRHPY